ncbi:hypothetical protein PG994_014691 [Apiospora phragmitis]|uniref:Uncharacterized protein n=1 Tax=Apiospora phragmitis TaxID=2905665 RepID=A0ABR1SW28_9PEZI
MALISPAASIGLIILFIALFIGLVIWKGKKLVVHFGLTMFHERAERRRQQGEEQAATNESEV